jgi:predicted O-methyltransferase YrrM
MNNWFFNTFPGLRQIFDQTAYKEVRSLAFLNRLVQEIKPKTVLELGTGRGCSTAFMALTIGNGRIVTIDNYKRADINNPKLVEDNLQNCGILDKVDLLNGETFDAGQLFGNREKSEVVFMDASHTAENLHKEYEAIRTILPKDHVIVVDDALYNDIGIFLSDLMKQEAYSFFLMLPFHAGQAILATKLAYLKKINNATKNCLELLAKGS